MIRNAAIVVASLGLALVGQVEPGAMGWISNIGGLGLAAYLVGKVIPGIVKDHKEALSELAQAINSLRVHCAGRRITKDE